MEYTLLFIQLFSPVLRNLRYFSLAIVVCLAPGCAKPPPDPAQLRADETTLIQATMTDPVRTERLLALLDERDGLIEEAFAMLHQYRREMKTLNADYTVDRNLMIEFVDYYNRERARKELSLIDLVTRMKRATTAAEWSVIADFELDSFNPRQMIYQRLAEGPGMLKAMLSLLLMGGGLMGGSILNPGEVALIGEGVEKAIDDPARAASATRLLDELKAEVEDFDRIFVESGDGLGKIYLNHGAGSLQMKQHLEALNLEWYASQNRNIKLRFRLHKSITAEEWVALFEDQN